MFLYLFQTHYLCIIVSSNIIMLQKLSNDFLFVFCCLSSVSTVKCEKLFSSHRPYLLHILVILEPVA